jgi:glycosyltransferase involved in cell wall biosynthesis
MNILFLSELFHPHGTGGELATSLYAKLLPQTGTNVVIVTNKFPGEPARFKSRNLVVYRLPLLMRTKAAKYSILRRSNLLISEFMTKLLKWADIVYIPGFWYSAIPLAKAYGKTVIVHLHGYFPVCPLGTLYNLSKKSICNSNNVICSLNCILNFEENNRRRSLEILMSTALNSTVGNFLGKLAALSDAIICVSEAQRSLIAQHAPSLRRKSYVIHNPLPELSDVEIENDAFGYFGGPNPLKGFQVLCRALTHIDKKIVHATNFPTVAEPLLESCDRLGVKIYEKLDPESLEKVYRQISTVVVPSICPEPSPYVVIEAILRKRLLIVSKIGGIPEQVEGCKGSFMFKPGDHERLAEIMEYVTGLNKETITDLGMKNRENVIRKINNETIIQNFMDVCENVVKK